jgi:hypothetical protein
MSTRTVAIGGGIAMVLLLAFGGGSLAQRPARPGQAAAEITGGPWIGSAPLSMAGLRGRVVLVEFWTYG